jgi:DNA gyrase subunit A
MGVVFAKPDSGDRIIAVARNPEGSLVDLDEPVDGVAVGTDDSPGIEVVEDTSVQEASTVADDDDQTGADETVGDDSQ